MSRRKLCSRLLMFFTLACIVVSLGAPAASARTRNAQVPAPFPVRIDSFLRQSGYDFRKVKENSWYINRTGKQLTQFRVIIGVSSKSIAIGAVVAPKRRLLITSDSMFKLLKLSYDLNYVRVCIDPDGDLLVMSQLKDGWVDFEEFKNTVERVATAADRAYGEVQPFLAP